jgi:tetratricopeptide (TPR) repeat protein
MTTLVLLLTTALLGAPANPAAADSAYFAGRPADAFAGYCRLLESAPRDTALLWRAARAALATGWLEPNRSISVAWYHRAQEYGRRALAAAPDDAKAQYWLAAALGREAQVSGDVRARVREGQEAYDLVLRILARAPDHAGAHNMLGQLHYQVMNTPWAMRVIGLRLLGARLHFRPSWEEAERQLVRAVELDPSAIAYRLELGRLYLRTGRPLPARAQLQRALALPRVHPPDALFQKEAAALMRKAA